MAAWVLSAGLCQASCQASRAWAAQPFQLAALRQTHAPWQAHNCHSTRQTSSHHAKTTTSALYRFNPVPRRKKGCFGFGLPWTAALSAIMASETATRDRGCKAAKRFLSCNHNTLLQQNGACPPPMCWSGPRGCQHVRRWTGMLCVIEFQACQLKANHLRWHQPKKVGGKGCLGGSW